MKPIEAPLQFSKLLIMKPNTESCAAINIQNNEFEHS